MAGLKTTAASTAAAITATGCNDAVAEKRQEQEAVEGDVEMGGGIRVAEEKDEEK